MEVENQYPIKALALKLISEGKNIDEISTEIERPQKLVIEWIEEFIHLKNKRLDVLLQVLKECSKSTIFTSWERMQINQERANLLSDYTVFKCDLKDSKIALSFYDYPLDLADKIKFTIEKLKLNE